MGGPLAVDRDRSDRDVVRLSAGTIVDLAGNLNEWTRDAWEADGGSCWSPSILQDPVCDSSSVMSATRGASFTDAAVALHAGWRSPYDRKTAEIQTGFRCARAAR